MLKSMPRVSSSDDPGPKGLALRTLLDEEETALLRYCFSLTGRREIAEEIVQDVFLELYKRSDEVDSPKAWLFRSVRNRAINFLRRKRREVLSGDAGADQCTGPSDTPEQAIQRMEALALLRNTLNELNETDRTLVQLKYFENLKYREISERTGLSVSNVGYRLHHLLKELASKLRPLGIDGTS